MAKSRANGEGNVRKRYDGRWEARYTDTRETDPKKRRKSIVDISQKVVVAKLKVALADVAENKPVMIQENPTVAEWVSLWLKEYKTSDYRDGTYEGAESHIRLHIDPLLGHIKIKDLTGVQIQKSYNILQEEKELGGHGLAASSVLKIITVLSGAMKQAVINNMIPENPVDKTTSPTVEDPDIRILTADEQKSFSDVLPFYNTCILFAVALATGIRIGELCALDKLDINREEKYININKTLVRKKNKLTGKYYLGLGPPKTKYSIRKVPLLPSVEVMLDKQAELVEKFKENAERRGKWKDNTLVFPTDEGNYHSKTGLRTSMGRILKRAGLPHIKIHALRHTYATTALNSGVAAQNVARLLGHKDGATTLRYYAHYLSAEAISQLDKLEEQNIRRLGLTPDELKTVALGATKKLEKTSVIKRIEKAINSAKSLSPRKSVAFVLDTCEAILCEPLDKLTKPEKESLLGALARYTKLKHQYAQEDKSRKTKKSNNVEI